MTSFEPQACGNDRFTIEGAGTYQPFDTNSIQLYART